MRKPEEIAQIIESNISVSNSAFLKNIGLSGTTIANMKSGSMPSADKIGIIAEALDVSVDYLLGIQKSPLPELTENEQTILKVFKELTDTQQGEIIGRAKVMAEQNDKEYYLKESV